MKFIERFYNYKIEFNVNSYQFVNSIIPINNKTVLDWGCRTGNFLYFSYGDYDIKNFTGVDVNRKYLNQFNSMFPQAKSIHYNRFNPRHNSEEGKLDCEWCLTNDMKYDIIFSLSVFTHTSIEEFFYTFNKHKQHLNKNGILIHTFIDLKDKEEVRFFMRKNTYKRYLNDEFKNLDYFYVFDEDVKKEFENRKCIYSNSFFDADYVKKELNCEIKKNVLTCAIHRN